MNTFIYDHYGYIVPDNQTIFFLDNWRFELIYHQKEELEVADLNNLVVEIDNKLYKEGVRIVLSKGNTYVISGEDGNASLVAVKMFNISLYDLNMFNYYYRVDYGTATNINLSFIKSLWEEKIKHIEEDVIVSIDNSNRFFKEMKAATIFYIGLGENAISYLEDIILDYGDRIDLVAVSHKRFHSFDSFSLLNPFNLVLDSRVRDLGELYKEEIIEDNELLELLKKYDVNIKEVMILFARIMFPNDYFDMLESYYERKIDIFEYRELICDGINKKMKRIKNLHLKLISFYNIREIEWIKNFT